MFRCIIFTLTLVVLLSKVSRAQIAFIVKETEATFDFKNMNAKRNLQKHSKIYEFCKKMRFERLDDAYPAARGIDHPIARQLLTYKRIQFGCHEKDSVRKGLKDLKYFESIEDEPQVKVLNSHGEHRPSDYLQLNGHPLRIPHGYHHSDAHLLAINAPQAWALTKGNPDVKIAVVDAYFRHKDDATIHPDLINELTTESRNRYHQLHGYDEVNDDLWKWGHGTYVALAASGSTNNGSTGSASIGYNTKLMLYNLYGAGGEFNNVLQAAKDRADIINCSFAYPEPLNAEQMIIDLIVDYYDALVVAAAGNNSGENDPYEYPASYDGVVSVTAFHPAYKIETDELGHLKFYDQTYTYNDRVDICAPSDFGQVGPLNPAIHPQLNNPSYGHYLWSNTNGVGNWRKGTSFSAPLVSGTAALMRSVNPSISARAMKRILIETANPDIYSYNYQSFDYEFSSYLYDNSTLVGKAGSGRLDGYAAVKAAMEYTGYDFFWSWFFFDADNNLEQMTNGLGDNLDWEFRSKNQGTPSSNTGPSGDYDDFGGISM